jgi:hypothetical protein
MDDRLKLKNLKHFPFFIYWGYSLVLHLLLPSATVIHDPQSPPINKKRGNVLNFSVLSSR